ncbi:hypothetical protein OG417_47125 [Actinoallomurus sp. NBC_01490]|uniref:LppU/SCO3897 family protein n=1 Tax=Actinoallomurus sp. NBC_01490 TaxID=2903557 RepID=UPI002E2F77A8|nr:hypothetical protein [Actinoallomurus sp. NBC_01490]
MVIVVIVVFVLLIGGGIGLAFMYGSGKPEKPKAASPSYSPPTTLTPPAYSPPAYSPPPEPSETPSDTPSTAAPVFDPQPGQCVKNTGTPAKPRLVISACTPGRYKIVDRIDGTTDIKKCDSTDYTYAVWFNHPKYVLCLKDL